MTESFATLLVLFLIGLANDGFSQTSFQCVVDSNKMLIGDQRTLFIDIKSNDPFEVDSIDFTKWNDLGVELLVPQDWSSEVETVIQTQMKIGVFDTGYIKLPSLPLYLLKNGQPDTIYSNNIALEVSGIMVDSTGLAPIKPILKEPLNFRDFLPYLIGLAAGGALIALIFFRKKRSIPDPSVIIIPDPPHEIALRDLNALEGKKLWQQGQIKNYQSELTHIIRTYLEGRYEIPALESTTSEVLAALQMEDLNPNLQQDLDQILNMADLIKFAKAKPDVNIHAVFMRKAEDFVSATKEELIQTAAEND